jgi:hypothetical protein
MTYQRLPPSSPPPIPQSVLLLRAVGDLQRDIGASYVHPDDIAAELGRDPLEIPAMVRRGIAAGYLVYAAGMVALSAQGWAWYEWDRQRRP